MRCSKCAGNNPTGKRFCGDCGTPLENRCATCGAENPPDKRFCGDCGSSLSTNTASALLPGSSSSTPDIPSSVEQTASGARWSRNTTRAWLFCRLNNRRSELPRNRGNGIRLVGAESACLDASPQKIPQRSIALRDFFQYHLDRLGDALPGSLRSGRRPATTSDETHCAREFR